MVWQDDKAKAEGFGENNTLIIDSEAFKVRNYKLNSVVIKPYTLEEVEENSGDNMNILTQCRDYVLSLLDNAENV